MVTYAVEVTRWIKVGQSKTVEIKASADLSEQQLKASAVLASVNVFPALKDGDFQEAQPLFSSRFNGPLMQTILRLGAAQE